MTEITPRGNVEQYVLQLRAGGWAESPVV